MLETAGRKANRGTAGLGNLKPAFWLVLVQRPWCCARENFLFLVEQSSLIVQEVFVLFFSFFFLPSLLSL